MLGGPRPGRVLASLVLASVALLVARPTRAAELELDFETVADRAQKLAREPHREVKGQVPDWLLKINYDQWRDIRFKPELALWHDRPSPFQVQFLHPGLFYETVKINVVEGSLVRPLDFSPNQFDYGKNEFASQVPQNLGYAGVRLHANYRTKDYFDEVIVFLGASYFRAVGKDQVFGLSARGLAIDTAESRGEEFPRFTEFWLVSPVPAPKPAPAVKKAKAKEGAAAAKPAAPAPPPPKGPPPDIAAIPSVTIFALLDSPSVAGAYEFVVTPGEQTVVKVQNRLYFRNEVRKLGVAPFTSMFFHGENTTRHFDDFRPEAHDSDGLQLSLASGEWLWRPVDNPKELRVSSFQTENPVGFGLVQRDRSFDHYQDLEAHYEKRPSVWIEPNGNWGPGRVEMVEIPTTSEYNDNIVSYWISAMPTKPGAMLPFAYTMSWELEDATRRPEGRAFATRRDSGVPPQDDVRRFVVDFEGKKLGEIPADRVLHAVVTVAGGNEAAEVFDQTVVKNTVTGGWRLTFQLRLRKKAPLDLRAFLDEKGQALTETWTYLLTP